MKKTDFYYDLPPELIAQTPLERRDASRLLTLDKRTGATEHHVFHELPDFLNEGYCLVMNDSRVIPARLFGTRPTRSWRRGLGMPYPAGTQNAARDAYLLRQRRTDGGGHPRGGRREQGAALYL